MKELYINHKLVDLDKETLIAMTFAVNDIADLKDRQANFSNIFKCPPTANNREIFGYADSVNFTQDQPYQVLHAKLIQNGIEIVPNGIAVIKSASRFFEVQVLSGLMGFVSLIEGKYLNDLVLPKHTFNFATVTGSQTSSTDFVYPLIDYGVFPEDQRVVNVKQMRPSTFNKTIIDSIITGAGYSYEGEVFDDPRFKAELIAFSNDKFEHGKSHIEEFKKKDLKAGTSTVKTYTAQWNGSLNEYNSTDTLSLDSFRIDQMDMVSAGQASGGFYKADKLTYVNIKVHFPSFTIEKVGNTAPHQVYVGIFRNNQVISLGEQSSNAFFFLPEGLHEKQEISWTGILNPGDVLKLHILLSRGKITFQSGIKFELTNETDIVYGQQVELEATLPKISQKDHLKDFMQSYGLTPVVDNYKKKIYFRSFAELYQNKPIARDWTDKFITAEEDATFTIGNYGQLNFGRYKADENVSDDLGLGSFTIGNQNLKTELDAINSQYSATGTITKLQGLVVSYINKVDENDDEEPKEFKIKTQPRKLINRTAPNLAVSFTDGTASATPGTVSLPYFTEDDLPGLHFNELFEEYYFELITYMLKKARRVVRYVMIDEADIAELDHFIPIYDANEATYYYLNRIEDYIEGEPTKCELIKM
ncbi:hypothetical protein [Pedobacter sp. SYSU D00535]|uniref:hypothetical protein n=1 Tax=Pedobacter sp. SYSU D00535 TaxID=2810308 RepID=UPI001A964785|nr:hypothetical protein [Pedobacter sp. SYSU D00535]